MHAHTDRGIERGGDIKGKGRERERYIYRGMEGERDRGVKRRREGKREGRREG